MNGDSIDFYKNWKVPTVIISDGAYGVNGFDGDLASADGLSEWYEPHIVEWSKFSTPQTTLWFWCTEQGWASVHNTILKYGWDFKACHIWDKGIGHIAGNVNTKTISHLPIVTEVCVQYVKRPLIRVGGGTMSMKEWLRYEWLRSGLPLRVINSVCEVKDAATRKWFTSSDAWYMPPADAFEKISNYANAYGNRSGAPYFSMDGNRPMTKAEYEKMKPKFHCPVGMTNVWSIPHLCNSERLKNGLKSVHLNQKPLSIMKSIIEMSSDENDVVWEPFGGLCTAAVAATELNRLCYSAEIDACVYSKAVERFNVRLF